MDIQSNKRPLKLHIISRHSDNTGNWVVCNDERGNHWSIPQEQYDAYRFTGMPFIGSKFEKIFLDLLNGRYYRHLPTSERKKIILKSLEEFFGGPIEELLPNVVHSNLPEMQKQKPVGTTN